jgi:hypothetical protein
VGGRPADHGRTGLSVRNACVQRSQLIGDRPSKGATAPRTGIGLSIADLRLFGGTFQPHGLALTGLQNRRCFLSACGPLSAPLALGFLDMSLQAMQHIAPMGVAERQMGVILRPFTVRQRHNCATVGI